MRHTRGCRTGRPAAYFALHRIGFFVPPASRRGAVGPCPTFSPSPRRLRVFRRRRARGCLFSVTLSVNAGCGPCCPGLGGSVSGRRRARLAARARRAGATTFLAGNPALRCPDFPLEAAKNSERRSSPKAKAASRLESAARDNVSLAWRFRAKCSPKGAIITDGSSASLAP